MLTLGQVVGAGALGAAVLLVYGAGSATNLLARYAATDLAEPEERSRAMGRILFAATFGAILGPTLVGPAEALGQSVFGLEKYAGPWLLSTFFFACAMVNVWGRLRPDPLTVWAEGNDTTVAAPSGGVAGVLCGFLLSWIGFAALALGSGGLSGLILLGVSGQRRREKAAVDAG